MSRRLGVFQSLAGGCRPLIRNNLCRFHIGFAFGHTKAATTPADIRPVAADRFAVGYGALVGKRIATAGGAGIGDCESDIGSVISAIHSVVHAAIWSNNFSFNG